MLRFKKKRIKTPFRPGLKKNHAILQKVGNHDLDPDSIDNEKKQVLRYYFYLKIPTSELAVVIKIFSRKNGNI